MEGMSTEQEEQFYEVIESFTNEERKQLLKFMSGSSMFQENKDANYAVEINEDLTFPKGQTCSFQLELPDFQSAADLAKMLRSAITMCGDIDDDEPMEDSSI